MKLKVKKGNVTLLCSRNNVNRIKYLSNLINRALNKENSILYYSFNISD